MKMFLAGLFFQSSKKEIFLLSFPKKIVSLQSRMQNISANGK